MAIEHERNKRLEEETNELMFIEESKRLQERDRKNESVMKHKLYKKQIRNVLQKS